MGSAWVPEAKEVQDATICWQGDDHSILGRKRRYYVGLFTQEKYNNWSVLCKLVRPAEDRNPWKLSKGVLLQQNNARVSTCKVAMDAVERNRYELIPHPEYCLTELLATSSYSQAWKRISVDFISALMKKSWLHLRSGSMDRALTFSVLGWWHLNTVGLSASH